jgi:hypothetical protein
LEIQQPALQRSSIIGLPKIEMPKQIDAMKMLKRHSALPQEKRYLKKPGIVEPPYSPMNTVSTYNSTVPGVGEIKVMPSNRVISSTRDLSEKAVASSGDKRCKCSAYKRVIIIGLFLLLLGLGVGGYLAFLYGPFDKSEVEEENGSFGVSGRNTSSLESLAANVSATDGFEVQHTPLDTMADIEPPPLDLEARCSVSNLPGALSSCLMACLPSACCYPNYSGDTCIENAGCESYKPYCDVFYDSWLESTEGVLQEVTDEMIDRCIPDATLIPLPANYSTSNDTP